ANGGVTLRADGDAIIAPPDGQIGLEVSHPGVVVDGFRFLGASHGVRAHDADGVVVRRCRIESPSQNGIFVSDTFGAVLDDNVVLDATGRGIHVQDSTTTYVRNNLVVGSGLWRPARQQRRADGGDRE